MERQQPAAKAMIIVPAFDLKSPKDLFRDVEGTSNRQQ
jgi:hypothetical protein